MNDQNYIFKENSSIVEKINSIRENTLKRKTDLREEQLKRPISYWTKEYERSQM